MSSVSFSDGRSQMWTRPRQEDLSDTRLLAFWLLESQISPKISDFVSLLTSVLLVCSPGQLVGGPAGRAAHAVHEPGAAGSAGAGAVAAPHRPGPDVEGGRGLLQRNTLHAVSDEAFLCLTPERQKCTEQTSRPMWYISQLPVNRCITVLNHIFANKSPDLCGVVFFSPLQA